MGLVPFGRSELSMATPMREGQAEGRTALRSSSTGRIAAQTALDKTAPNGLSFDVARAYQLNPFEIAAGIVTGDAEPPEPLGGHPVPANVRIALEEVLLDCLKRRPCLIAFSGGRDSSGILALATALARRNGLVDPIPATNIVLGDARSAETEWQERVVSFLRLQDWRRRWWEPGELDLIGPVAEPILRMHGTVYPSNAHFMAPIAEEAAGGTLVTGIGGDELFLFRSRLSLLRSSLLEPGARRRKAPVALMQTLMPRSIYAPHVLSLTQTSLPWLLPHANALLRRELVRQEMGVGWRWSTTVSNCWWRAKRRLAHVSTLQAITADCGVSIVHPFMSTRLLSAAIRAAPLTGFASRTVGMTALFGDVLPEEVLRRRSKAIFNDVFFSHISRRLVAEWDGAGLEELPINPNKLKHTWSQPDVDARSSFLLQELWQRTRGGVPR